MKLKEKINQVVKKVFDILKDFPITLILIFAITLFLAIFLDTKVFSDETIINVVILFFSLINGIFFSELYFKSKKNTKYILFVVFLIISALFTIFYNKSHGLGREYFYRIYITYNFVISILSIYILYRKSELSIERYLVQVSFNSVKVSIVYNILSTGIMLITSLFSFLILGKEAFSLIWRVLLVVFGFAYLPGIIFSFINKDKEIISFVRFIIKYIMEMLLLLAFIIIYIYMLKILVLWQIPSNQIFRILAILFALGLPIWTMCGSFREENGIIDKINNKIPILFIPFIFLQIYSLGARIYSNGFTILRYLCLIFLIVEIVYILIYIINKNKIYYMFMIVSALVIISLLVPKTNMFDVSYLSQSNRIKSYLNKDNLSDIEKSKINSSYIYLNFYDSGKEYFKNNFSTDQKKIIKKYVKNSKKYVHKTINFDAYSDDEKIKISGYNVLQEFEESSYSGEDILLDQIEINGEKYNLSKVFKKYRNNHKNYQKYFNKNNEVIIDSNTKIIFTRFNFNYNTYEDVVSFYDIQGYVLKK